ncbi:hypothetical protein MRX96_044893 [Rhipicephalus microplus]
MIVTSLMRRTRHQAFSSVRLMLSRLLDIIIHNALEQDSVMRRERHKLQMDVLLLKKTKLKLALERRMRL